LKDELLLSAARSHNVQVPENALPPGNDEHRNATVAGPSPFQDGRAHDQFRSAPRTHATPTSDLVTENQSKRQPRDEIAESWRISA
jgi:hypothetical protein